MAKAPAFQFYVKDWLSAPEVRRVSAMSRGVWIDLLCFMWLEEEQGRILWELFEVARATGVEFPDVQKFIFEAQKADLCEIEIHGDVTNGHTEVTIINRRMHNEWKDRYSNRIRKQKQRASQPCPTKVTPPSSSASSSAITKKEKDTPPPPSRGVTLPPAADRDFEAFWQAYPKKRSKGQAQKSWAKLRREKKLPPLPTILQAIAAAKAGHDWQKDGGQFIPHPSTWLNGHGWEDESQPEVSAFSALDAWACGGAKQ